LSELPLQSLDEHPSGQGGFPVNWLQDHERRRTALSVAILLGLILLFYYRLWWPGLILINRDALRFFAPIRRYVAERLLAGQLPEWFPYESLGRSVIGSTVAGVFHPFTVLYLALPAHDALRLSTLLACLLGGLGAFALGRILRLSRAAAMVAGLGFVCSGYVVSTTEAITYLYGICALPLFCAALNKALEGSPAWLVAPAAIWATVFLNGDIQTGYYYGFIALLWAAACAPVPFRRVCLRAASAAILAGLLAGIQLAPSFDAFLASERTDPVLFHDAAMAWPTHPLRLFTVLAAPVGTEANQIEVAHFFFGSNPPGQGFVGLLTDSLYMGVPLGVLACVGAWFRRDLRGLVWLGLGSLWLALGHYGGLYEIFYHLVPLWSAFRYPEKLMGVASFAVAMLAGAGVDALRTGRAAPLLWLVSAGVCAGLWGILQAEILGPWVAARMGAPPALTREVLSSLAVGFLFSSLAVSGVWGIAVAMRRGRLTGSILAGALMAVAMLDLARVNQAVYRTGPVEIVRGTPAMVEAIRRHAGREGPGHFRIFSDPIGSIPTSTPLAASLGSFGATSLLLRQGLHTELNAEFLIESINVYMPGQSAAVTSLRDLATKDFWVRAYARYNVAYLIGFRRHLVQPPFDRSLVATVPDYDLALVQNPIPPKPRAYLSRQPQPVTATVDLSMLMKSPDFLAGRTDYIETADGGIPGPSDDGRVVIERYAPEEVRVRVETPRAAILILLDAFENGWQASLENGDAVPIRRANALVRAVAVPAGTHVVTFTYRTPLLAVGAWCSFAGALICAGLVWRARRKEGCRRLDQEQDNTSHVDNGQV
jgi:hypothetical protein